MVLLVIPGEEALWSLCGKWRVALASLLGLKDETRLQAQHQEWVDDALRKNNGQHQKIWSDGVAVGSQAFVEKVIEQLGIKGKGRSVQQNASLYQVKELAVAYTAHFGTKKCLLSLNND